MAPAPEPQEFIYFDKPLASQLLAQKEGGRVVSEQYESTQTDKSSKSLKWSPGKFFAWFGTIMGKIPIRLFSRIGKLFDVAGTEIMPDIQIEKDKEHLKKTTIEKLQEENLFQKLYQLLENDISQTVETNNIINITASYNYIDLRRLASQFDPSKEKKKRAKRENKQLLDAIHVLQRELSCSVFMVLDNMLIPLEDDHLYVNARYGFGYSQHATVFGKVCIHLGSSIENRVNVVERLINIQDQTLDLMLQHGFIFRKDMYMIKPYAVYECSNRQGVPSVS